jgi:hypothetical protein
VPSQPALCDRALDAGAVFGRTAAGGEKGAIDPLDIDAGVLDGFCGVDPDSFLSTADHRDVVETLSFLPPTGLLFREARKRIGSAYQQSAITRNVAQAPPALHPASSITF